MTDAPQLDEIEIREYLGSGVQADVFAAWHVRLTRDLALKIMRSADGDKDRFRREVRALGLVTHPHIIDVVDNGDYKGRLWVALRLVDGSLADRPAMTASLVVLVAVQIAGALQSIHNKGVHHRDVKPANILVTGDEHFYLADFGVADLLDMRTEGRYVVGTFQYSAPEVLAGTPATAQSDQYSLGVTLATLLLGRPPYPGAVGIRTATEFLEYKKSERSHPLVLPDDCPEGLVRAIERTTAWEPEDRFPDMRSFAGAIADVCEALRWPSSRFIEVPTPTRPGTFWLDPSLEPNFHGAPPQPHFHAEEQRAEFDSEAVERARGRRREAAQVGSDDLMVAEPTDSPAEPPVVGHETIETDSGVFDPPLLVRVVQLERAATIPSVVHEPRPELFDHPARQVVEQRRRLPYWYLAAAVVLITGTAATIIMNR